METTKAQRTQRQFKFRSRILLVFLRALCAFAVEQSFSLGVLHEPPLTVDSGLADPLAACARARQMVHRTGASLGQANALARRLQLWPEHRDQPARDVAAGHV